MSDLVRRSGSRSIIPRPADERGMVLEAHWSSSERPSGGTCFIAFPGVGDIGLLALELIEGLLPSKTLAEIIDPTLPSLARLDEDGILRPPHHRLVAVEARGGPIHLFIGSGQTSSSVQQHEVAKDLIAMFQGMEEVVGLAGFRSDALDRRSFFVATSEEGMRAMKQDGRPMSHTEPRSGCIGVLALLTSLGPRFNLNTSLAISTTFGGNSKDPFSAQRLTSMLDEVFDLGLPELPDVEAYLQDRLASRAPATVEDHVAELTEEPDAFYV